MSNKHIVKIFCVELVVRLIKFNLSIFLIIFTNYYCSNRKLVFPKCKDLMYNEENVENK